MFRLSVIGALFAGAAVADEICLLPVDVVILQDTTGSFVDDLPNVSAVLPSLVDDILKQNPGSMFAATDFKDKPYRDLGEPDDHCYKLWAPLTSDKKVFCDAFSQLYASGGGDKPEAQLQALINVVQDKAVGWRTLSNSYKGPQTNNIDLVNETGARLVILSTDATPHDPKDYEFYNGSMPDTDTLPPRPPMTMPDFPDDPSAISPETQCTTYDYPTMAQAAAIVKAGQVNVVFLIPQNEPEALEHWREFNEMLGQPASFVQFISADSSDAKTVILKAMSEVSDYVCNQTTTTPAPTTTTPAPTTTTPAPTTTTPAPTTTTPAPTTTTPAPTTTTPAPTTTTPAPTTTTPAPTTTTPAPTTTTLAPTTTTPAPTTTTPAPTTMATTTAAPVTTAGTTQTTVPATTAPMTTAPATTSSGTCPDCPCPPCPPVGPCGPCECECPEVVIKLRHRPVKLHFNIQNAHE